MVRAFDSEFLPMSDILERQFGLLTVKGALEK